MNMRYNIFILLYKEKNNFFTKIIFSFLKFITKFIYGYIELTKLYSCNKIDININHK